MVIKARIDIWGAMKAHQDEKKEKEPDLKHFMVPFVAENKGVSTAEKEAKSK
jgi:hypothetical protein